MVPRQKAGHMTACHPIVQNIKKSLANRGRPHMSRWRVLLVKSGVMAVDRWPMKSTPYAGARTLVDGLKIAYTGRT